MIIKGTNYKKLAKKHKVRSTSGGRGVITCEVCKLEYFVSFHDLEQKRYKNCPNGCNS